LNEGLERAISAYRRGEFPDAFEMHERVKRMYYWPDVATRTERVYERVLSMPRSTLRTKLSRYFQCGFVFGLFFILVASIDYVLLTMLEFFFPAKKIVSASDVPTNISWKIFTKHPFFRSKINRNVRRKTE